jgi:hypothetical protein
MAFIRGPQIVTNGLILALDASNRKSYPRAGTTWYDLSGRNAHGTINGTVSFISSGAKSYFNFATAASTNYISSTVTQTYLDFTIVFQPDFTLTSNANLVGLIAVSNDTTNSDKSLRFLGANGTGPWTIRNPDNTDGWASTTTTFYLNGVATTTDGTTLSSGWNILGGARTNTTNGAFASPFAYFLGTEGYSAAVRDFRGKIALCYMYNRALTANEQLQNFNAIKTRFDL